MDNSEPISEVVADTYWRIIIGSRNKKASGQAFAPRSSTESTSRLDGIIARSKKRRDSLVSQQQKKKRFRQQHPELYDRTLMAALRLQLIQIFGERCLSCSSVEKIVVDHIVSRFLGGTNDLSNTQPLCWRCNKAKGLKVIDFRPNKKENK
jgi:5-methylcytosine-specific restriction endonuclease McrA